MNISKTFGKRLKSARNSAGLSQPELAALCGWESQSRLSNYERGERTPSLDDMEKLANALKTNICALLSPIGKNTQYSFNEARPPDACEEASTQYRYQAINTELQEVVEYALCNQLKSHYQSLSIDKQVSLVFELYNSVYTDKALLDAAKDMQPATLLKMVNS